MLSSVPLLLEAMGWFEVGPEAWELKESWDSSLPYMKEEKEGEEYKWIMHCGLG